MTDKCTHLWDELGICRWCKINVRTVVKRLMQENRELETAIAKLLLDKVRLDINIYDKETLLGQPYGLKEDK